MKFPYFDIIHSYRTLSTLVYFPRSRFPLIENIFLNSLIQLQFQRLYYLDFTLQSFSLFFNINFWLSLIDFIMPPFRIKQLKTTRRRFKCINWISFCTPRRNSVPMVCKKCKVFIVIMFVDYQLHSYITTTIYIYIYIYIDRSCYWKAIEINLMKLSSIC